MRFAKAFFTVFSIISILALIGCGGGAPAEASSLLHEPTVSAEMLEIGPRPDWNSLTEPVEVQLWHAIAQSHEIALNDIIAQFEEQYPMIHINAVYQGSYADLFTALLAAMRTSSRPTMSMMYESWTSQFMELDLVVPAQAFIDADDSFGEEELSDFYPSFLANNTWGENIVTLPFNKSLYLLFANLDALEAKGLGVPQTWDELRDAAIALSDPENNISGFGVRPFIETVTPFFLMNGGQFIVDGRLNLESPESLETLQYFIDLTHGTDGEHGVVYVETAYLTAAFGTGNVPLFTGSSAGIPYCATSVGDTFRWTAAPLPSNGDHPRRVLSQGTNMGIYAGHSNEETWAAWEFLKFMTNSESSAHFAAISGFLPVRRSSLEVPEYAQFLQENAAVAVAASQLEYAAFEPRMPVWESIRATLNRVVSQMFQNPSATAEGVARNMIREAMSDLED